MGNDRRALSVEDNVWEETPENRLDMGLRETENSLLCQPLSSPHYDKLWSPSFR